MGGKGSRAVARHQLGHEMPEALGAPRFPATLSVNLSPPPITDLRHIFPVSGDILPVLDQLVAHRLLDVGSRLEPAGTRSATSPTR